MTKAGLSALFSALFLLVACGDDDRGPMIAIDSGGTDGGVEDSGPGEDAGPGEDSGPGDTECRVGDPCDPGNAGRECRSDGREGVCATGGVGDVGSSTDPIDGFEMDSISGAVSTFRDGYCTNAQPGMTACDPDTEGSCPSCSRCLQLQPDFFACLETCEFSRDEEVCAGINACDALAGICLDGCTNDDACRVARRDTDMDGEIDAPAAGEMAVDRLVWDDSSNARCDMTTNLCRHDGTAGATAGDPCTWDGDCEADGRCFYGETFGLQWNDADDGDAMTEPAMGYCTKFQCDPADDSSCANGGKCQSNIFGEPICFAPCEVAKNEGMPADPGYLNAQPTDCRPGFSCIWDGETGAGMQNGSCFARSADEMDTMPVTTPNVGAECDSVDECWSPLGLGRCLDAWDSGIDQCFVIACDTPLPGDVVAAGQSICGEDAVCIGLGGSPVRVCQQSCETASDCPGDFACLNMAAARSLGIVVDEGESLCFPDCAGPDQAAADATCADGFTCQGFVPGMMPGTCTMM